MPRPGTTHDGLEVPPATAIQLITVPMRQHNRKAPFRLGCSP
jgi:hypothetical protein